jgi:hypothetical protein
MNNDNEGYSKLKHIINENVISVLSENKQVISIAFIALLQTLTSDPKMVNSIYAILLTNGYDCRHNDNDDNDNAIKYLESNKDKIFDLVEKHYENLVEALTKNVITAAASSSFFIANI